MKPTHLYAATVIGISLLGCLSLPGAPVMPLEILEPAERTELVQDVPVSVGLVFPENELTAVPGGAVVDDRGGKIPFDYDVTGWWSGEQRSVKWLLLHFKASARRTYRFEPGPAPARTGDTPLAIRRADAIEINTGPLQVRLAPKQASVFDTVFLNGLPLLAPAASFFEMVDDEGRGLTCGDAWRLTLEENTPLRTVVRADGALGLPGQTNNPLARLSIRYEFFKSESFVRMYHTFTWMQKSLDPGANRIAIRLQPHLRAPGKIRIGLSDYTAASKDAPWTPAMDLVAYQDAVDHYTIRQGGRMIDAGKHLGGWIGVEGNDGRGVGISLKNCWQTYPKTLAVRKGTIEVGLWPEEAGRFSFEERDIMPDDFYYDKQWTYVPATREGGPTWFNTKDVLPEWANDFLCQLQMQMSAAVKSPGKRIGECLPPELRTRIQDFTPETPITDGFRARLAHGMNSFLAKRDFYEAAAWTGIELRPKAKELLAKGPDKLTEPELIWLNRLLIESAFPEDLARSDVPHFIHEFSPFGAVPRPGEYLHTGEGAARTHELTVLFYDRSVTRTAAQLNSLTQHPFVIRQAPAMAVRVPFFGFPVSAVNRQKYPDLERAVDLWGYNSFSRYPELHEYGFLRFGMQRSNAPRYGLYRWFGGMQYDQLIIPWLLFLRGGDRRYYEEGMNTAMYAMDIHVNHYNTRGAPTGYMSFLAGMPLPWSTINNCFNMRVPFLSCCRHITGYRRAQEVMTEAIEGRKAAYRALPRWGKARELFADNMFLAHAYAETFDPLIKDMLKADLDHTLAKNYNPASNLFTAPTAYLFDGLIPMHDILKDEPLRQVMLTYLRRDGAPALSPQGGLPLTAPLAAYGWAYEQTGDQRYAQRLYDQAQIFADVAPEHDWSSAKPVAYPMGEFEAYAHRLLPLVVAMGTLEKHGLVLTNAPAPYDLFVSLNRPGNTRTVYAKALKDGDLVLRLFCKRELSTNVTIVSATVQRKPGDKPTVAVGLVPGSSMVQLTIPQASRGEIFRLMLVGGDAEAETGVAVLSEDAHIVHKVKPGFVHYSGTSWQYYRGTRVFVRLSDETLTVRRSGGYTVRDAKTRELLFRSGLSDPIPMQHHLGKGRLLEIVMTAGRDLPWSLEGISSFVSARAEDWFEAE